MHKFGAKGHGESDGDERTEGAKAFIEALKKLPPDFKAKCDPHKAMKALLPNALFFGFTGTPLLKADKQKALRCLAAT